MQYLTTDNNILLRVFTAHGNACNISFYEPRNCSKKIIIEYQTYGRQQSVAADNCTSRVMKITISQHSSGINNRKKYYVVSVYYSPVREQQLQRNGSIFLRTFTYLPYSN